ncbi:NAD(P)H-dependent oxidoreductase [Apilactobacillus apisilvae]|uniref:NAD(P)H-dependent oxidoreductase n=1 Tax=Apilactobacillus apisilvae TaxID=2923364 RepID=A0ABY4PH50_9LACO|nr:NAD(P)H-dependent oxidoreductase [Apilactobacillus apisilvae]UQS84717.1 NAD(P)H-dependent oxidoreductase [Apilactobacillus apisilvae]
MKILVIQGHPDKNSFTHANAINYYNYAKKLGNEVNFIDLSENKFDPFLRYGYRKHMENESYITNVQNLIKISDHIAFFFPIWWASEPSILKGLIDRTFTPRFAYTYNKSKGTHKKLLSGKTADIFTSSHGPSFFYKLYGKVFSKWKHLILGYCGIKVNNCYDLGKMENTKDTLDRRKNYIKKCSKTLE